MSDTNQLADITHTIQLAVAPVFLLSALGTVLSVLATRLGRIIDRARLLEARFPSLGEPAQRRALTELDTLSARAQLIHRALLSSVGAALCVCLLITTAFVGYLSGTNLGLIVATFFIVAMGLFAFGLVNFMRETMRSVGSLRFGLHAVVSEAAPPTS